MVQTAGLVLAVACLAGVAHCAPYFGFFHRPHYYGGGGSASAAAAASAAGGGGSAAAAAAASASGGGYRHHMPYHGYPYNMAPMYGGGGGSAAAAAAAAASGGGGAAAAAAAAASGGSYHRPQYYPHYYGGFRHFYDDVEMKSLDKFSACAALIEQYVDEPVRAENMDKAVVEAFFNTTEDVKKYATDPTPAIFSCCHIMFQHRLFEDLDELMIYRMPDMPEGSTCADMTAELENTVKAKPSLDNVKQAIKDTKEATPEDNTLEPNVAF